MRHSWRMKVAAVLAVLLCTAGCVETMLLSAGAIAAIGSYKWIEGTMEKDYPRPLPQVWNATLAACKDLNLKISGQQYGALDSKIEAVQPPDTSVKIELVARPNDITTLKVRFGFMGNQDASAYFHRRVLHHLGIAN